MVGLGCIFGTSAGLYNSRVWTRRYYEIHDLKVLHQLDTVRERGQTVMDAGVVFFATGNELDPMKSWHFKHRTLYCVAPITTNGQTPESHSYDFWAVGKDCCSLGSSDFRCGAWGSSSARSAIRVMDDNDIFFYRLAVQQAETLYGIMATQPVFFEWAEDPLAEVNSWNSIGFKNYLFLVCAAFVFSLLCLAMTSCRFAFIGRGS